MQYSSSEVFYLSEVQKCCLLIHNSNFSKSAYNFIPTCSTTIADYSGINYLLQVLVFLVKIGIISIVSGSKKSKFNIF